jgi:hypothetical protein
MRHKIDNDKLMPVTVEYLDDIKLVKLVNERIDKEWDKAVEVNINELL